MLFSISCRELLTYRASSAVLLLHVGTIKVVRHTNAVSAPRTTCSLLFCLSCAPRSIPSRAPTPRNKGKYSQTTNTSPQHPTHHPARAQILRSRRWPLVSHRRLSSSSSAATLHFWALPLCRSLLADALRSLRVGHLCRPRPDFASPSHLRRFSGQRPRSQYLFAPPARCHASAHPSSTLPPSPPPRLFHL